MTLTPADLGLPSSRFPSYRPGQLDTILEITTSPRRFRLLSAPTGAGKTAIYMSLPSMLNSSTGRPPRTLVLTGTKTLQSQVHRDFKVGPTYAKEIYGHSNYPCVTRRRQDRRRRPSKQRHDEHCTASSPETCAYRMACVFASQTDFVVGNYAHWITLSLYSDPTVLGRFDLLVLDEAHTALNWMTNMLSVHLDPEEVGDLLHAPPPPIGKPWEDWAIEARSVCAARLATAEAAISANKPLPGMAMEATQDYADALSTLKVDLDRLAAAVDDETSWVAMEGEGGDQTYSPVWPHEYTERHLFRAIPNVVLASANIQPGDCSDLGIAESQFSYHEGHSIFDPRRRPLTHLDMPPRIRVDSRTADSSLRHLVRRVDRIIDAWADYKGVIHTRSYRLAKFLTETTRHQDIMISHSSSTAKNAIQEFKRSHAPRILVSPAVEEGHDFPGDECRYQIILKVPFLYAGDPLTKARTETDRAWSERQTARDLLQTTGRGMRSPEDWCVTMILDDHWRWFRKKPGLFPHWFKYSWRVSKSIPGPIE